MNRRLRAVRLLLIPVAVVALVSHHVYPEGSLWDTSLAAAGLVLLLTAMAGRIWASLYLAGRKDRTLVTSGPYAYVRNPLYLFSFIGFVGAGLAFESVLLGLTFALIFFVSHLPAMRSEEARLANLFGAEYERYRGRVPALIPWLGRPGAGVSRGDVVVVDAFRFRAALRDCMAIPLVFVVADLLEWAKLADLLPVLILLP